MPLPHEPSTMQTPTRGRATPTLGVRDDWTRSRVVQRSCHPCSLERPCPRPGAQRADDREQVPEFGSPPGHFWSSLAADGSPTNYPQASRERKKFTPTGRRPASRARNAKPATCRRDRAPSAHSYIRSSSVAASSGPPTWNSTLAVHASYFVIAQTRSRRAIRYAPSIVQSWADVEA